MEVITSKIQLYTVYTVFLYFYTVLYSDFIQKKHDFMCIHNVQLFQYELINYWKEPKNFLTDFCSSN